jgi:hypothetical protein
MVSKTVPDKWDRSANERITKADRLDIMITSIERVFASGRPDDDKLMPRWATALKCTSQVATTADA